MLATVAVMSCNSIFSTMCVVLKFMCNPVVLQVLFHNERCSAWSSRACHTTRNS